ncbi:MAG: hypothetical protein ACRC2T_11140 [Thermoguttaceae bacterium]
MPKHKKTRTEIEFGDFQTPVELARKVVNCVLSDCAKEIKFRTVIEPTCGIGNFLLALLENPLGRNIGNFVGLEINPEYVKSANERLKQRFSSVSEHCSDSEHFSNTATNKVRVIEQDFFKLNLEKISGFHFDNAPGFENLLEPPILFIGNPPWVTNSQLGSIKSSNLPEKENLKHHKGIDALTGKANFDISESILIRLVRYIVGTDSAVALLVKTSVARKVFEFIVQNNLEIKKTKIYNINAASHFGVTVDACLFYASGNHSETRKGQLENCPVFASFEEKKPIKFVGHANNALVSDAVLYKKWKSLDSQSPQKWRSGIKHDCARIMELKRCENAYNNGNACGNTTINLNENKSVKEYVNGHGEHIFLPDDYVYPLLKATDVSVGNIASNRFVIVTQRKIGEPTEQISVESPETWEYLARHREILNSRKSRIYENNPRFSIFGIGDYSFAMWKIGISGLHKDFRFTFIPPRNKKPVMLDDTCYFLGFNTETEAAEVFQKLNSKAVNEFLESIIFKDEKRPITAKLLNRINWEKI